MRLRLILTAIASTGLYAAMALREETRTGLEYWVLWAGLVALYAIGVRIAGRRSESSAFVIIVATSILFRGALFLGSGDAAGFPDVFLYRASPLTELFGRLELNFTIERVVCVSFDLAALALAPRLLKAARMPIGAAIVHGWNPLAVTEAAWSARIEVVSFFLLLLALRLIQVNARWPAALVYGASLTGPLMNLAALPLVAKSVRARIAVGLSLAIVGWALAFPEASWAERTGWPPESFLGGSVSPALAALARLFVTRDQTAPIIALFALWAALASVRALRCRENSHLPHEALIAAGGLILVSPQVLPWAFVAVAYLALYSSNRGWIAFTVAAPLTYAAIEGGSYGFLLGFAQYFVPGALTVYWWLGRSSPRLRRTSPPSSSKTKTGSKAK